MAKGIYSVTMAKGKHSTMAKGKHAPTKGAVREDKVLHPTSRKVLKMAKKVTHRYGSYFITPSSNNNY